MDQHAARTRPGRPIASSLPRRRHRAHMRQRLHETFRFEDFDWRTPLLEDCPKLHGAPFLHVHRADLHRILAARVADADARLATACTGVEQAGATAVASFADGSQFEADVIVGADGIHSAVRQALFGEQPARFTGHMCWRAVVPFAQQPLDYVSPDASFWLGPNGHVVTYYVQGGR